MARNKYFRGTIDDFKKYLQDLYSSNSIANQEKYVDIKNSVVYISEHIGEDPIDKWHCNVGAIYAHGAIIAGDAVSMQKQIDIIDTSINEIEEILHSGVVNSIESVDAAPSDYIGIAADVSRGNVTLTLNTSVSDATTAEFQNIENNGLATKGYVEERLDKINWEILDSESEVEPSDKDGAIIYESNSDLLVNISSVKDSATSLTIKSSDEVTING